MPAAVQLPQSVRDAVAEPIPKEYDFELELSTVKQWNQLQNRKYAEAEAEKKRLAEEEEAEAKRKEEADRRRVEAERKREAAETEAAIERVAHAEREAKRQEERKLEALRQAELVRQREMEENQKAASLAVLAAEEEGRRLEAESKRLRDLALQDKQQAKDPPPYIPTQSPPAYSASPAPPSYSAAPPAYSAANPFTDRFAAAEAKSSPSPGPYNSMNFPPEHAPKLQQMLSHTGANMDVCRQYLQDSNYDVNQAINRYWDSQ